MTSLILCTGPSFGRAAVLKSTIEHDQKLVTYKKIFLSTNDEKNLFLTFNKQTPVTHLLVQKNKQLDCLNCIISSIKNAVNDPEIADDDIILFKHESVFINDLFLVHKAIERIKAGSDCVIKYWIGFPATKTEGRLNDYYHSDSFYIQVKAARPLFKDHPLVSHFTSDYQFCEEYLTKYLINPLPRVYPLNYHHSSWQDNELGLFHIPNYADPPGWLWNKQNYWTLYP